MTDQPQTVTAEVAKVSRAFALVDASAPEFAKILPAHIRPEQYARWALTMLRNGQASPSPKQREAWARVLRPDNEAGHLALIGTLMDCASLGLEPGRTYHVVPFGDTVEGITDYKGELELMANAAPLAPVIYTLVYAGDDYETHGPAEPPHHQYGPFGSDRGDIIGGYAYQVLAPLVYSRVVEMSEAMFERHRKASKTGYAEGSPWVLWGENMRCKTLVHELRKSQPWSPERRQS